MGALLPVHIGTLWGFVMEVFIPVLVATLSNKTLAYNKVGDAHQNSAMADEEVKEMLRDFARLCRAKDIPDINDHDWAVFDTSAYYELDLKSPENLYNVTLSIETREVVE